MKEWGFVVDAIHRDVEHALSKAGLLFRVFSRKKSDYSLRRKVENNPGKYGHEKKIQDVVGIRVVLYFLDDVAVSQSALQSIFSLNSDSSIVDNFDVNTFSARRHNLVFQLPDGVSIRDEVPIDLRDFVDDSFEVQIRTTLSEGWHEVDHDLRYKNASDWEGRDVSSRALNGVYAALETSDWTILKIFDELAYDNYKEGRWAAMLRSKFRLRLQGELSEEILLLFDQSRDVAKGVYRVERLKVIRFFSAQGIPVSLPNLAYVAGYFSGAKAIVDITPRLIKNALIEFSEGEL